MRKLTLSSAVFGIAFLLLYFYSGELGVLVRSRTGMPPLIWLPSGLGLAGMILVGFEIWPLIFIGSTLIMAITQDTAFLPSVLIGIATAAETLLGAFLFRRCFPNRVTFTKVSEIFGFVVLVMIASNGLGATVEVSVLSLFGSIPAGEFFVTWRSWWMGQALGNLIVGTMLIWFWNDGRHQLKTLRSRLLEAIPLGLAIPITASLIFTPLGIYNHSILIKPYFLFSMILWTALRFDLIGAMYAAAVILATAVIGTLEGYSAFSQYELIDRTVAFQFFISALNLTGLVVAASVREKSEALEARNEFLGIASHELKTPITSLKMNLQMLRRRIIQKADKSVDELAYANSLAKVDRQINRLVAIVEQLLDVSQAERNKFELHREEVDLNTLVRNLLDRLAGSMVTAKCTTETKLEPEIQGYWDPFRIEQILENLISNAIKYAPGKPIRVESRRIGTSTVEISVSDQGPGIDAGKRPHIFDRFVRATENTHVQGLGLGLFITRQIVKAHGGQITVDNEAGCGSRFTVRLPLGAPTSETTAAVLLTD